MDIVKMRPRRADSRRSRIHFSTMRCVNDSEASYAHFFPFGLFITVSQKV